MTIEVEYIATAEAAKETVWMKKLITELGVVPSISELIPLLCDNNRAIVQAKEPRSHQKSKHILRCFHLIWEIAARGDIIIEKFSSEDNIVDPLSKPLSQNLFEHHLSSISMRYVQE